MISLGDTASLQSSWKMQCKCSHVINIHSHPQEILGEYRKLHPAEMRCVGTYRMRAYRTHTHSQTSPISPRLPLVLEDTPTHTWYYSSVSLSPECHNNSQVEALSSSRPQENFGSFSRSRTIFIVVSVDFITI